MMDIVLKFVIGVPFFVAALTVYAVVLNAPLILLLFLGRHRLGRRLVSGFLSGGFAAATAYMIWQMEWFDVWRHGIPPFSYFLTAMIPYVGGLALIGWLAGASITRRA